MDYSTLQQCTPSEVEDDLFTPEFKRLKARKPPPNLEKVIDLDLHLISASSGSLSLNCDKQGEQAVKRHSVTQNDLSPVAGLKHCKEWVVFEFLKNPGFFVILNPFVNGYQRYWVSRCLQDFPLDGANVTNMTGQQGFDLPDVWNDFTNRSTFEKKDPLRRLRWTTLGYHYDWNTKEYSDSKRAEFPLDVHQLSEYIATALGFEPYSAEAAIVNYYHMDSTLAGHTDHSEVDLAAPLFSISFGQTAIFLLGGQTKSVKPTALFLRSGDICVMSGPSRLAYHAVPKILPPLSEEEAQKFKDAFTLTEPTQETGNNLPTASSFSANSLELSLARKPSIAAVKPENFTIGSDTSVNVALAQVQPSNHQSKAFSANWLAINQISTSTASIYDKSSYKSETLCDSNNVHCHFEYSSRLKQINSQILDTIACQNFKPFERYLASSRINLNIRQVLPCGRHALHEEERERTEDQSKKLKICDSYS
ncbi:alkylated DNA repair protein alkb homolog 1-like [Plakobranchus ocellatus]|uniref:Alkylated DNA repair protein alkb homolog 1-like n=1 Tax=Plakobranchus ocellatus TaxID=259542 RepID=A0AAV4CU16_9GAST|nr:alkylated DNA repair protein alkb homolog 1-like [Plakobranchus ocellatus]